MSKRRSLRCYGNNFCNAESLKSAMIKLPLEMVSHLHGSLSLGSRLSNSFQLPCIPEPQICHAEVRRDALLTRPWAGLGLSATPTSREPHSSWAGNEAHRSKRKLYKSRKWQFRPWDQRVMALKKTLKALSNGAANRERMMPDKKAQVEGIIRTPIYILQAIKLWWH